MSRFQVFDSPVIDRNYDLFNVVAYAEKLAGFIESVNPPFTIGIYGEWGDGKTSFVRLLEHFVTNTPDKDKIKFISFSAWPHTTSDALWRALIIKIARDLYGVPDDEKKDDTTVTDAGAGGLLPLIRNFLQSDAITLSTARRELDSREQFNDLVSRLDSTVYGSISRNQEHQLQVNHEVAVAALVKTAVAALGTISPLVAGIRALFGIEPKVALSELMHKEKNVATREIIKSVQEFKQVFRTLFDTQAKGKRVFVFVDDLDRCLPDVALDILEAIKIFLDDFGCIFIVAADKNLIGQGLRLRYRELLRGNDDAQIQDFFAQKGQEYFEKIIQFGVGVPPRTAQQTHRFISAQFPIWTPASDIIQAAVGDNPRRLKQYCNLLTYKHTVSGMLEAPRPDEQ